MAFSYYKTVTINHSQCGTVDSSNWPLRIAVTDADLKTVGNGGSVQSASGFDIRPYSNIGLTTALTFELVNYVPTTGQLEMYVKIPTLSVSTDVVIYLAFGDATITTDGTSNTTWDTGFVGIYHFGKGSTLTLTDSSQKGFNGTNGSATVATGYVGGGANLTSSQYIDIPGLVNYFASKPSLTMSINVFPATTGNAQVMFTVGGLDYVVNASNAAPFYRLSLTVRDGVHSGLSQVVESPDNGYVEGAWNRIVAVADAVTDFFSIWKNGVLQGSATAVFDGFDPGAANYARIGFSTSGTFPAIYDEVRISDVVRSPSWITADENNQKPSSTFLTFGTKVSVGGATVGSSQSFLILG